MESPFVSPPKPSILPLGYNIFEKAYRDYFPKLETYAATLVGEENATDVVQDVFLYMWNSIDEFSKYSSVYAYLRKMVYCQCVDLIRHNRIEEKYISEQLYTSEKLLDDVDQTVGFRELNHIYNQILEQMPSKRRDVFVLQQTTGLSLTDIGRKMNISVKTVDCHLANARKTLRQKLLAYRRR